MSKPDLTFTQEEARVMYTALNRMWVPGFAYLPLRSAVEKLLHIGGGECCRDCSDLGVTPDRLGGLVCNVHHVRPPLQTFNNSARESK